MSAAPVIVQPAKLVVALLAGRVEQLDAAAERLRANYGPTDVVSEVWPFDSTDYYAAEMGADLLRQLLTFETLIDAGDLAAIKLATNALEADFAAEPAGPSRPVNIDPGYVVESKLVLASCKGFAHRVYLGRGVHAEITLGYVDGHWRPQACTFPEYACGRYFPFLTAARSALRRSLGRQEAKL